MKKIIPFFVALSFFAACQQTEDEKAAPLMNTIDSLYKAGNYQATLNAITACAPSIQKLSRAGRKP